MNGTLFGSMLKMNGRTMFSYAFGSALYVLLIVAIYPSFANADALNELLKTMPENIISAFGLQEGIQDFSGFLASEYYGLIFMLIMMIYCVMTATQLVARLVDRGSMAYLLATPASRTRIAVTQAAILFFGLLVIMVLTVTGGLAGVSWIIEDPNLDLSAFIEMNVVGFLLFFVVSGYSFFFSCLLNDEKRALSISGSLTVLFFVLNFAGKMSEDFDWLLNLTLFSVFKPSEIARGEVDILPISLGLSAVGLLLYVLAVVVFRKRDLPL